jgi:hypothetical protein
VFSFCGVCLPWLVYAPESDALSSPTVEFFVATDGNDSNPGTLERARDAVPTRPP